MSAPSHWLQALRERFEAANRGGLRPSKDEQMLAVALVTSARGTCVRRRVGCVLTDAAGHVLATGYNGGVPGAPHCNEPLDQSSSVNGVINAVVGADNEFPRACPGAFLPDGKGDYEVCEATHAEQNALLQCRDVREVATCYCTTPPCVHCVKLLLNTGCRRVVSLGSHRTTAAARALWRQHREESTWVNLT
jgi:dCMP deaminase